MIGTAYYERDEVNGQAQYGMTMSIFEPWKTLEEICENCDGYGSQSPWLWEFSTTKFPYWNLGCALCDRRLFNERD